MGMSFVREWTAWLLSVSLVSGQFLKAIVVDFEVGRDHGSF